jgi:acid phosphatase type 7
LHRLKSGIVTAAGLRVDTKYSSVWETEFPMTREAEASRCFSAEESSAAPHELCVPVDLEPREPVSLTDALTRRRLLRNAALAVLAVPAARSLAAGGPILPYLQAVTPNSIWVSWLTDTGTETIVDYGTSAGALTSSATGGNTVYTGTYGYNYHSVQLIGLSPNTFYYYKVRTGTQESNVLRFRTLPVVGTSTGRLRFLVVGDNQILNEPRYETILARARTKIESLYGVPLEESVAMMLNVGDQVDVGTDQHYKFVHFAKETPISPNLPVMTIVGNHETYSDTSLTRYKAHFNYTHLGYAGIVSPGGDTYYSNHVANILFIHLNSEDTSATQTAWVQSLVNAAKTDASVEWIVSLVHRPYQAEQYIGDISTWFRNTIAPILAQTPKHVLNIGAHHHIYARGQMRDWPVYHIISGGTAWDQFWGQSSERDYDDVQKTIANWAWQILDFDLTTKELTVTCYAEAHPKLGFVYPSKVIDTFHRKFGLAVPEQPSLTNTFSAAVTLPLVLTSSPYSTTSGEALNSTQFQIAADTSFTNLKVDLIRGVENFYGDTGAPSYTPVDIHSGLNILQYTVATGQLPNGTYHSRVRHRDTNVEWSAWSVLKTFTVQGSVIADPKLTLSKTVLAPNEDFVVTYENGPGLSTDWIGIYPKGIVPDGDPASTTWQYVNSSSRITGTRNFTFNLAVGEWFAAFFTNDGYTQIAPPVPFYVGNAQTLTSNKTAYNEGETVQISYNAQPGSSTDWVGVYRVGHVPGSQTSTKYAYVPNTTSVGGSVNITGLAKGFYFAVYFVRDGYFEISPRIAFSVGDEIATVAMSPTTVPFGQDFTVNFSNGPGTPKDYMGIFTAGATPGVERLVTYLYVGGVPNGSVTFTDDLPAGDYFLALFINDSYTEVSNRINFSVTGGPQMPLNDGLRQGTGNTLVMGVKVKPGTPYRLVHTTDFVDWNTIQSFTGEGLRMEFTIPYNPLAPRGFYRVVSP